MASPPGSSRIPLIYRVIFLYIEPLFAFLGACQALYDPAALLAMQTPKAAVFYRPELRSVTTQIAGGWLFLAFNDVVLLRLFPNNTTVWRCVLAGGLLSDVVYVSSILMDVGSRQFFDPRMWSAIDAFTVISTLVPMLLKIAGTLFLEEFAAQRSRKRQKTR